MGVSKFPKTGLSQLWGCITSCADLRLRWDLKQSCSPRQELSKNMLHVNCTQGNQGDSRLLVVGNQFGNSTPGLSFGHNLCFTCPNESCEPISNIYVSRAFQWYKELFNPMTFDPYNLPLKIWESIRTPTTKMGIHFGVWGFIPSHFLTFSGVWNVTPGFSLSPHLCKPLPWSRAQS